LGASFPPHDPPLPRLTLKQPVLTQVFGGAAFAAGLHTVNLQRGAGGVVAFATGGNAGAGRCLVLRG
jgi:hypothetical protein